MWVAVGFLTYMILWMRRESRTVAQSIREGIDSAVERGSSLALVSLVFVMALREGIETALFVFGISRTSEPLQVALGAVLGVAGAVALGYAVYAGGKRIDLGTFFKVTGVFLILVAAGLLAHGVAEFQEAGLLPTIMPLWDVSGSPVLGEGSIVSEFLTAFFGWDPEANLLELLAWFTYVWWSDTPSCGHSRSPRDRHQPSSRGTTSITGRTLQDSDSVCRDSRKASASKQKR